MVVLGIIGGGIVIAIALVIAAANRNQGQ
jgi:hypothetical protein